MPQSDRAQRVQGVGQSVAIHSTLRGNVSNFYGGVVNAKEDPIDTFSFKRGDGGIWLCVAKRFNTSTGVREVIFGHGSDFVEALISANAMIAAAKWVTDKPWGR